MNITLKEIAKKAGVSPSTVSRTLSDHPSISLQTKEKIRKIMQEMEYEPTTTALSIKDSKTIAVVLPVSEKDSFENSFFLKCIRGISLFCNKKQYYSVVITGASNDEVISALDNLSKENKLDGVILLFSIEQDPIIKYLQSEGILYLLIGKDKRNPSETIYIDNDNISAGKEATDYLLDLGHTRIGYIGTNTTKIFSAERKSGYMLALAERGIPISQDYILEMDIIPKSDDNRLMELLSMEDRPTGLVVVDDIFAMVLDRTASKLNLRIPEDLSIISFNNSLISQLATPQLTSIDVNSQQLGIEAASQIINHIENPYLLPTKIIVPHFLVKRGSCKELTEDGNRP